MSDDENNNTEVPPIVKIFAESDNVVRLDDYRKNKIHLIEEFLSLDIPPTEMIMHPWLPKKGIAMVHSKRGVGKTFFCLSIAYAIATGKPFLGWTVPKPRKVLYIDGEMSARNMQDRIANIMKMFNCYDVKGMFHICTPDLEESPLNLYDIKHQRGITKYIEDNGIEVVFVDNISSLMYGFIENEANSWEPIQGWELLLKKLGTSMIRVMHTGKTDKVRASSKVEDILDTTIYLKHPNDYDKGKDGARFVVEFEKNRGFYGNDAEPFEMNLKTREDGIMKWERQDVHVSTYNLVVKYIKEGYKNYEISDLVGINRGAVTRYKKRAQKEGLISYTD